MNAPDFRALARVFGAGLAAALFLAACSKPKPRPAEDRAAAESSPEFREDPAELVFMRADELLGDGKTNEALRVFQEGLEAPELAGARQHIFNGLIRFLLSLGRVEEAKEQTRRACREDAQLAQSGAGLVYSYLHERGDHSNVVAWTEEVLAIPSLPADVRRNVREWNLQAYLHSGDDARMLRIVEQLLQEAPAGGALGLIGRAVDTLFDQQRLDAVEQILKLGGRMVTSDPGTQHLLLFTRLRLQTARGEWQELEALFPTAAATLPDADLHRLLRQVLPALIKAGKISLADSFCEEIVARQSSKPQSLGVAARYWTESAAANDPAALPARLETLLRAKLPVRQLCSLYMRFFYEVIDDPAIVKPMKALGERLVPLAEDDDTRNQIRTMVLDGCFVLEDYDAALRILEEGIAGRDALWHNMAVSKVKAHKALRENRHRDAVRHFREFMATVANAKEEDTSDPATGLVHTRAMILGRNAKRIGDILAAMPDPDPEGSRKAYAEAREYFEQALKEVRDEEVKALIEKELAEVPRP
jgi:tetratricopeptide (TPR) repeat protein